MSDHRATREHRAAPHVSPAVLTESLPVTAAPREHQELYRTLYEHIPLMYFQLDRRGYVLSVNEHGARELGYAPEELVGRSVLDVFHPDDRPAADLDRPRMVGDRVLNVDGSDDDGA